MATTVPARRGTTTITFVYRRERVSWQLMEVDLVYSRTHERKLHGG